MAREKVSGVYCIENTINKKKYIGQSNDIYSRWNTHKSKLRKNKHENSKLQNSVNKYGIDKFNFYILEICNKEIISEIERYYIDKFDTFMSKNGYNLTDGGEISFKMDDSIYLKKAIDNTERVIQFDINMNALCCHINVQRANKLYAKNTKVGLSGINQCISGKTKTIYGYIWKLLSQCIEEDLDISIAINTEPSLKKFPKIVLSDISVVQLDKDGNLINEYKSCWEATKKIGEKSKGNIQSCCEKRYGRRSCYGFYWMYLEDYIKNGFIIDDYKNTPLGKMIGRYNKDTLELLEVYESARDASAQGYNYKNISQVCNGERKTHSGFIWKFIVN